MISLFFGISSPSPSSFIGRRAHFPTLLLSAFFLLLFFSTTAVSAERITGAFGFDLGEIHSKTPRKPVQSYGIHAPIPITPRIKNDLFDTYFVRITPMTGRIHAIEAVGPMDFFECRRKSETLLRKLEEKYGAGDQGGAENPLGLVFNTKRIAQGKREIILFCNPISFFDGETNESTITIKYLDNSLYMQALDEQKELESRETDDSGL